MEYSFHLLRTEEQIETLVHKLESSKNIAMIQALKLTEKLEKIKFGSAISQE